MTKINNQKVIRINGNHINFNRGLIAKFNKPNITHQIKYSFSQPVAITHVSNHALYGMKYAIAKSIKALKNIDKKAFI